MSGGTDNAGLAAFYTEMQRNAMLSKDYKEHLCRIVMNAVGDGYEAGLKAGREEVYRKWNGTATRGRKPTPKKDR